MTLADAQLESAFREAPIGMAVTSPVGQLLRVNPALCELLGMDEGELVGSDLFAVTHPDDLAAAQAACASIQDPGRNRGELACRFRHADGHYLHVQVATSRVDDASLNPQHLVMHVQDTSESARLQAELTHRALHDGLTELPNRALFIDRLAQALRRADRDGSSVGVLFVDLDHFKAINDGLGHSAGDRILQTLAHRLRALLRPGDTAARLGGDEFTVLCENIDMAEAQRVAARLATALAVPFGTVGDSTRVSVSIGVAMSTGGQRTADELLNDADVAMYAAKARGRNQQVVFVPELQQDSAAARQLHAALRQGVELDEFTLQFQPVVDLREERVIGFDAVLNWQHPSRGLLRPEQFLAMAQDHGMLETFTRWVLEQAARQAASWADTPGAARAVDSVVWVEIAAQDVTPELLAGLEATLARHPLPVGALGLALSGAGLMWDLPDLRSLLDQVRDLGVRLSISALGTGYSSLAALAELPVDTLRIGPSLTRLLPGTTRGPAVLREVLRLGASLGLQCIVIGVETAEQLQSLHELGGPNAQGSYLAPPVPPDRCPPPGSAMPVRRDRR